MTSQICPHCKKEFIPRNNILIHTFCSRKCQKEAYKEKQRINAEFRKEIGLPIGSKFYSKYKKVDE